jgi:hypothetical protein
MRRKRNVGGGACGTQEIGFFERDFGGHVYQEKLHWFSGMDLGLSSGRQV